MKSTEKIHNSSMHALAAQLNQFLSGLKYCVFVFNEKEHPDDPPAEVSYISNQNRRKVLHSLKEFIRQHDDGEFDQPKNLQ